MQHFVVVFADQGELEPVLRGVDRDLAGACGAIETVQNLALHPSEVNGLIESSDNPIVTICIVRVGKSCNIMRERTR